MSKNQDHHPDDTSAPGDELFDHDYLSESDSEFLAELDRVLSSEDEFVATADAEKDQAAASEEALETDSDGNPFDFDIDLGAEPDSVAQDNPFDATPLPEHGASETEAGADPAMGMPDDTAGTSGQADTPEPFEPADQPDSATDAETMPSSAPHSMDADGPDERGDAEPFAADTATEPDAEVPPEADETYSGAEAPQPPVPEEIAVPAAIGETGAAEERLRETMGDMEAGVGGFQETLDELAMTAPEDTDQANTATPEATSDESGEAADDTVATSPDGKSAADDETLILSPSATAAAAATGAALAAGTVAGSDAGGGTGGQTETPSPRVAPAPPPSGVWNGLVALLAVLGIGIGGAALWQDGGVDARLARLEARPAQTAPPAPAAEPPMPAPEVETLQSDLQGLRQENRQLREALTALKADMQQALQSQAQTLADTLEELQNGLGGLETQLQDMQAAPAPESAKGGATAGPPITESAPPAEPAGEPAVAVAAPEATTTEPEPPEAAEPAKPAQPVARGWAVNLLSFPDRAKAETALARLQGLEIPVAIAPADVRGQTWYRLRVGGFATQKEAQKFALAIRKKSGLSSAWVGRE